MPNSSAITTHARRLPKQGRSKALVDAICESCLKIINNGYGDELSVSLIIKTAGVTKSSFYQYFPNVDTAIGYALANYDRGYNEEDFLLDQHLLQEMKFLSLTESIELIVNAAFDRHARLLKKYGRIYRRFHRNFTPTVYFNNKDSTASTHDELNEFLRCIFAGHQPSLQNCSLEAIIFLMVTAIIDFTGKAIDFEPKLIEEASFRKTLVDFLVSYFRQ
jgi:AcrR family transcriptional regulator